MRGQIGATDLVDWQHAVGISAVETVIVLLGRPAFEFGAIEYVTCIQEGRHPLAVSHTNRAFSPPTVTAHSVCAEPGTRDGNSDHSCHRAGNHSA